MSRSFLFLLSVLFASTLPAIEARAQFVQDIDGLFEEIGVFNDFPDSVLTITNDYPTIAVIDERDFGTGVGGAFANRHDLLFSSNGGSTPRIFDNSDAFDISFDLTLEAGSNSPRKEAGLRVNSNSTGAGLFIINTDASEIVAFGGPFPFYSFNTNAGISYTAGDTLNMRAVYTPPVIDPIPANTIPGTMEYIVDLAGDTAGPFTSGPLNFTNLELGILNASEVGVYLQAAPAIPTTDFATATYENFVFGDGATPMGPEGDYNDNGVVDAADYTVWRDNLGGDGAALANRQADLVGMPVTAADYDVWKMNFGATGAAGLAVAGSTTVPEPTSLVGGCLMLVSILVFGRIARP